MTETEHTLFIQYDMDDWTAEELQSIVDSMDAVTPKDTTVMLADEGFEFMSQEQVEKFTEQLIDALD